MMNSRSLRTRGTLLKFEKFGGSEIISQLGCGHKNKEKNLPCLHAEVWPDWDTNPIRIQIQRVI